jgi:hypothetical protein
VFIRSGPSLLTTICSNFIISKAKALTTSSTL